MIPMVPRTAISMCIEMLLRRGQEQAVYLLRREGTPFPIAEINDRIIAKALIQAGSGFRRMGR